jgi:hypothetical protein
MKFIYLFLFLWVFFALLDPDPDSGSVSTDLIETGSGIRNTGYSEPLYSMIIVFHFPQEIDHSGAGRRRPQEVHCRPEEPLRGLRPPPPPLVVMF